MLSGCGQKEPPLVVLTTGEVAPFSMKDKNDNLTGFDIELVNLLAETLGRDVEWKCVRFDDIIKQVQAKRADIGIGAISITEDREQSVNFSPAYHIGGFALLMLEGTSDNLEDLISKKFGVRQGTWQEKAIKTAWADKPNLFVQSFGSQSTEDILAKLRSGELVAFVLDADEAKHIVDNNNGLKIVPLDIGVLGMGIVTAKGSIYSSQVADFFEKHVEQVRKLETKWFSAASNK
jgi:polar amino acid transport system substrate-binding protein